MPETELNKISEYLFELTPIEKLQKLNATHIQDIPSYSTIQKGEKVKFLDQYFFANKDIYISKHNRFADYPSHSHGFFEMNYMFSGSCIQIINGNEETLNKGDLLLMDVGTTHEIKALGEKDILINILFRNSNISIKWLNSVKKSRSLLFEFLLNSFSGVQNQNNYLIFHVGKIPHVQHILHQIFLEYFFPKDFSGEIISLYLPILFTELIRNYNLEFSDPRLSYPSNENIIAFLELIEKDYKNITLKKAAEKLGYNKNYLSNLVKEKTGLTFTELVTKQRLNRAKMLLETTNHSISSIIQEVGFTNKTYFYRAYRNAYRELPSETKKKSNG